MAANPPRYFSASGEITDILSDFTHLFEPEALWHPEFDSKRKHTASSLRLPARFNMDFEMLPEKEAVALARQIGKNVRQKTWMNPAIGVAQNKFVAQIAATLTRPNHSRSISPTETPDFLSSRSIHFLPLDKETSRRLSLLGIRTLGQLTALPLTTLQTQIAAQNRTGYHFSLGHEFSTLYALAKEEAQSSLTANNGKGNHLLNVQPLDQERIERLTFNFDSPVSNLETVKRVLRRMADELAGRLQSQNSSCQTMNISVELEGSSKNKDINGKVTSRHPTANPEQIAKILNDLFRRTWSAFEERGSADFRSRGVIALAMTARDISSTTAWQLSLFQPIKATTKAIEVVENLIAKHGSKWFYKAEILRQSHPLPEQRFRFKEIIPV
jgi:nucleotidyltransferase/DNA polymerase involved in DNA repair